MSDQANSSDVGRAKGATYGNFRDPLGLVWRMLRSRDPAALSALGRAGLERIATPADLILGGPEARRVAAASGPMLPPFLIVGLPRSGTTFVYQMLARWLPFSYFSNLSALFPRAPITITRWAGARFEPPKGDTRNFYGNTTSLHDVNDGFHVWNRWLGDDRYEAPRDLPPAVVAEMRRFFAAWSQAFGRPLLNKNNRNAFCIELLSRVLPGTVFVVVRRDPVYVAQSLLKARKVVQGNEAIGWSLGAFRPGHVPDPDPIVDVVEQVAYCEREVASQLAHVAPERQIDIEYEAFCREPAVHLQKVWQRMRTVWPGAAQQPAPDFSALAATLDTDHATLDESNFHKLRRLTELARAEAAAAR